MYERERKGERERERDGERDGERERDKERERVKVVQTVSVVCMQQSLVCTRGGIHVLSTSSQWYSILVSHACTYLEPGRLVLAVPHQPVRVRVRLELLELEPGRLVRLVSHQLVRQRMIRLERRALHTVVGRWTKKVMKGGLEGRTLEYCVHTRYTFPKYQ